MSGTFIFTGQDWNYIEQEAEAVRFFENQLRRETKKVKPKRPVNEFKVRHKYRNNVSQSVFKISSKNWLDIEWVYKVKYESGREHLYTESHFRYLVEEGRFRRIQDQLREEDFQHFDDEDLFEL